MYIKRFFQIDKWNLKKKIVVALFQALHLFEHIYKRFGKKNRAHKILQRQYSNYSAFQDVQLYLIGLLCVLVDFYFNKFKILSRILLPLNKRRISALNYIEYPNNGLNFWVYLHLWNNM